MVKQYSENQYDDDLTVGTDDYDDSYYTGSVDLFEFANDEESPISRLKSLILSIDWEITDEILMQFNEELVDLRDIWAGDKINLVYVQALEKISKYIYQKKADSHPSAIKLLLTLYHNLEKIVSSADLSEEEKKEILLEDVKRFENLKRHIGKPSAEPAEQAKQIKPKTPKPKKSITTEKDLFNLKAIVLGIDWEITDQDLNELRQEVVRLEEKFADSRPKLILLQGIGTLGAYIKLKKSNTHSDAFKVLHLFYESLEKIVSIPMTLAEEKAILFPAVERFNSFKTLLGPTIAPEALNRQESEDEEVASPADSSVIAPAFADLSEEEVKGFQAEEEAQALGLQNHDSVDDHVESFFMGSGFQAPQGATDSREIDGEQADLQDIALQGVNVEIDDEEEDEVTMGGGLAPALSDSLEATRAAESAHVAEDVEVTEDEEAFASKEDTEVSGLDLEDPVPDADFPFEAEEEVGLDFGILDKDVVLEGVKVESEADDDSDEEALPMLDGELAPALVENDEVSIYNADVLESSSDIKHMDDEISGTLGKFFDEEKEPQLAEALDANEEEEDIELIQDESQTPEEVEEVAAADQEETDDLEESPSFFDSEQFPVEEDAIGEKPGEEVAEKEQEQETEEVVEGAPEDIWNEPEVEPEIEEETLAFVSELDKDESLDALFDNADFGEGEGEAQEEVQEEGALELDEKLDAFFDLPEEDEEVEEDKLLFSQPEEDKEEEIAQEEEVDHPAAASVEEEEVVFQLVEEDEQQIAVEPVSHQDEEETFAEEVSAEEEITPFPLTENQEEEEETEEEETVEDIPADLTPVSETEETASVYSQLHTCVDSLGLELDDKVISALLAEIEQLEQHLADKPLEKTFLQLVSTLTRHIDQNRYDSSPAAYGLLQSTSSALSGVQENDLTSNIQLLLTGTQKVLKWQEDLLAQQIASDEAQLTIGDSLSSDQDSGQGDFNHLVEDALEENAAEQEDGDGRGNAPGIDKDTTSSTSEATVLSSDSAIPAGSAEVNLQHGSGHGEKILTDDLKLEISTLRQTLQDEIAALRKELKK